MAGSDLLDCQRICVASHLFRSRSGCDHARHGDSENSRFLLRAEADLGLNHAILIASLELGCCVGLQDDGARGLIGAFWFGLCRKF